MQKNINNSFTDGLKDGIPICLGYLAVSISFGMIAVSSGVPVWVAIMLSMTNMTSAGQYAAVTLATAAASYGELVATTLIINLRYALMGLVLTRKLAQMPFWKKMLVSAGITDEIFTVASTKGTKVGASYLAGLILTPYLGWALGTILGSTLSTILPQSVNSALGISLFAMFVAIVIPEAAKKLGVLVCLISAVAVSCAFRYIPPLSTVSEGWVIIIAGILGAGIAALLLPEGENA